MSDDIFAAVQALKSGGVIAYPTEAVYGLGCNPSDDKAIQRILDLKRREAHKGFILIASSQEQLAPYLGPLKAEWQKKLDAAWPGPVTFVLPASDNVSALLSGQRDTLAVRVSKHPQVVELCNAYGGAIVSTSANRSGQPALQTGQDVQAEFTDRVDAIVDAHVGTLASPTQIFDIRTGKQLR